MNLDIIEVRPLDGHILRLIFHGGEVRDMDMRPYLDLGIFGELRDDAYFRQAYVEFGSVEWPGGQGLSYDTLYLESAPATMNV